MSCDRVEKLKTLVGRAETQILLFWFWDIELLCYVNSNILDRYQKGMVATQGRTLTSTGKVQCVEFKIFLNRLDCMFYLCSEAISPAVKSCLQFTTRITWDFLQKCSPQGTFPTGITPPGTRCHWMQKQCASVSLGKTLSWCAHMGNLKEDLPVK